MIRQKTLEDERIKLASIVNILTKQNNILDEMNFCLMQSQNDSQKSVENGFDISLLMNYSSFCTKLSNDIKLQEKIIEKTKKELDIQQEKVKQAYIKVKSLENLKEKQKKQYDKEVLMEEYKMVDDIVNAKRTIA